MSGTGDEWSIAAAHAARMLPGVFPPDDPLEALSLAPEHAKTLRDHLRGLDAAIFQADDSLGWTYQFWRAAEKKAVERVTGEDRRRRTAGGDAVVHRALHGAFSPPQHARRLVGRQSCSPPGPTSRATPRTRRRLRTACALPGYAWDFLRFVREDGVWRPAAGVFPGWPAKAAALTVLDPCCGSGHFLTEALSALAALRAAEENLSPAAAVVAVLRDNLAGLEIDGPLRADRRLCPRHHRLAHRRCGHRAADAACRLGRRAAALAESGVCRAGQWRCGTAGAGWRPCMICLSQAPLLGSLIEPTGGDLIDARRVARIEDSISAPCRSGCAAPSRSGRRGRWQRAAWPMRRRFCRGGGCCKLTNVPFLGRGKQDADLAAHLANADLPSQEPILRRQCSNVCLCWQ